MLIELEKSELIQWRRFIESSETQNNKLSELNKLFDLTKEKMLW